jgi:hypothetical protein
MSKLKYKKLHKLLKNNALIANSITEKLYALKNIEIFLQEQIPEQLLQHIKPLNISGNTLVLLVDSPAWKSRLRFLLPDIEKKLQQRTAGKINHVTIKIIPDTDRHAGKSTNAKNARAPLSSKSQAIINSLAENMDESRLKTSLLRLGQKKKY